MRGKIVVWGTGEAGREIASAMAGLAAVDVVMVDQDGVPAPSVTSDLHEAVAATGAGARVSAAESWSSIAGATVVVLAGGDPGPAAIRVAERCPDTVIVVAQEPVEASCRDVLLAARFPRGRVVGVAGAVEGARLRAAVADALGVSALDVSALTLGGRGAAAVPVLSSLRVGGLRVTDKLPAERVAAVVARLHAGPPAGPRVVAACVAEVVDAIVADRRRVLACATLCLGELGLERAVAGVPVVVAAGGVERILDATLDQGEREELAAAAVAFDI